MQLKQLSIRRRAHYEPNPGTLAGNIEFTSPNGEFSLHLEDDHCHRLLEVVADLAVAHTRKMAELMTAEVLEANRQLPAPSDDDNHPF